MKDSLNSPSTIPTRQRSRGLLLLATALALALCAAPAQAAPPSHPPLPDPIQGFALNHACGTAIDTEGDIYVASAGNSKIEVFDPSGNHLASIPDSNAPCGLAVDTNGKLYVSDTANAAAGKVFRYTPNAFPLTATPTYGAPATIDSSGNAKGISVDPTDNRLYVAEGTSIATYDSAGNLDVHNEEQSVIISSFVTGGTFTLSFKGQTTGGLQYNVPASGGVGPTASVQNALEALTTIGPGNVSVTGTPADGAGHLGEYNITFVGALANTNVENLVVDSSALIGGNGEDSAIQQGFSGHIGVGALTDATGVAAYTSHLDPSNSRPDRYVFAADPAGAAADKVYVFGGTDIRALSLRQTIDGSETPDGGFGFGPAGASLAADPANGHFLVYDAAHSALDEFEATGQYFARIPSASFADAQPTGLAVFPAWNEVQQVVVSAAGGTFTLSFDPDGAGPQPAQTTDPIPRDATTAQIQSALEALSAIGSGNVSVAKRGLFDPYIVTFTGALANRDLSQMSCDGTLLTSGTCEVAAQQQGSAQQSVPANPGGVYVTAGASAAAKLFAFGPVSAPSRLPLPALSFDFAVASGTVVDKHGDIYVAGGNKIGVFSPSGAPLTSFGVAANPAELAVDSQGNLYAHDHGNPNSSSDDKVVRYTPDAFPLTATPTYGAPTTITDATSGDIGGIAVDPANDHLLVARGFTVSVYDSAASGNSLLDSAFGQGHLGSIYGVDVCAKTGDVYVSGTSDYASGWIKVLNPAGTELLATIDGSGSPGGTFPKMDSQNIAVDQSNCHVVVDHNFENVPRSLEEYEASGAFVAEIGDVALLNSNDVAIDNSGGPNDGNLYSAFDGIGRLYAFAPLAYRGAPLAVTGIAGGIAGGDATLNGTVDPQGFPLTDCHFEYETEATYISDGNTFASATHQPCAESLAAIGSGIGPVAVHADLTTLDPSGRYRFRLVAANQFGAGEGDPGRFGPPHITPKPATGVHYSEANLNATLDPSGLTTTYHFEYGDQGPCDSNPCTQTASRQLAAAASPTDLQTPLFGLAEGTTYHFCLVATNAAGTTTCEDQAFTTLARSPLLSCPNDAFRTGSSANLPDCRAYELVTPPDTGRLSPTSVTAPMNVWRASAAGDSLLFYTLGGVLPGFDGNGANDGYRAQRGPAGWSTELAGPTYAQSGVNVDPRGNSPDGAYSFWGVGAPQVYAPGGTLPPGSYLRGPAGFQALGQGLGTDPNANGEFISSGAGHVIFSSTAHLEPDAPPAGTRALYDRTPGGPTHVVSLLPGEITPAAGQDATYLGTSDDGSAVAFKLGGALYVRRNGATVAAAPAPNAFAGLSDHGERLFYADANLSNDHPGPAGLFAFDVALQTTTQIAPNSLFVDVSPDGSRVYFTSTDVLDAAALGTHGADNLYLWDGSTVRLVAILDPRDLYPGFDPFPGVVTLGNWSTTCLIRPAAFSGRAACPSRTTPDGRVIVFQSHASLTAYDSDGKPEIYRYDAAANGGAGLLTCVSCDPSGAPPATGAGLQSTGSNAPGKPTDIVPNLTSDGQRVFFESADPLLPEDTNGARDVYEWTAQGAGGCTRPGGCLALISSGPVGSDNFLYAMTPDGHDVFIYTYGRLVSADVPSSPSFYDVRVDGGFAEAESAPCAGDACQGQAGAPPNFPGAASAGLSDPGNVEPRAHCAKGKHRVVRGGKARCVTKQHKKRHHQRKRHHHRRSS